MAMPCCPCSLAPSSPPPPHWGGRRWSCRSSHAIKLRRHDCALKKTRGSRNPNPVSPHSASLKWTRRSQIAAGKRKEARETGGCQVRCASKPAMRVLKEAEKAGGNDKAVLRKSRSLSRVVQMEVLEELVRRERCELVVPMYQAVREAAWYKWDANLHARIVAMVAKGEHAVATTTHLLEPEDTLSLKQRVELGCALIESYACQGLQNEAHEAFQTLRNLPLAKARPLGYKAMVRAYALLANPIAAEKTLREMESLGHQPSVDEYKVLLLGYGKAGMLIDMERVAHEVQEAGVSLDAAGYNMMISAYCYVAKLRKMVEVLWRMDDAGVRPTMVSWNALTKACPTLAAVDPEGSCGLPCTSALLNRLHHQRASPEEIGIVQALLTRGVPSETETLSPTTWQLDMHNMSLGTASIILPMWLSSLRDQFEGSDEVPVEVRLVTGWGKHSEADVKAPVRRMVIAKLEAMKSPFRVDSKNRGALIARGSSLKTWLLASSD